MSQGLYCMDWRAPYLLYSGRQNNRPRFTVSSLVSSLCNGFLHRVANATQTVCIFCSYAPTYHAVFLQHGCVGGRGEEKMFYKCSCSISFRAKKGGGRLRGTGGAERERERDRQTFTKAFKSASHLKNTDIWYHFLNMRSLYVPEDRNISIQGLREHYWHRLYGFINSGFRK